MAGFEEDIVQQGMEVMDPLTKPVGILFLRLHQGLCLVPVAC